MPTALNEQALARYRNDFLREVEERVDEGGWVKMCMQCGVCAGSCPFGPHWEHSPQKIFMMIRAGKREEVLASDSMWMCTSCYNCVVRCPRKLPITTIMHGLATYAHRLGLAPKRQPTRDFSVIFWENFTRNGRANEIRLMLRLWFRDGFGAGIRKALAMKEVGLGMLRAKRMSPFEIFGGHGVKDVKGFQAMIRKAQEIEDRKRGFSK
ncbi:MAG: 4Fe-4S dicluster domain-containing protein [Burkholderiales bacterium]|nr:4Fe-4S dicluster domain-containing protein [Burkholderiales bacterium]